MTGKTRMMMNGGNMTFGASLQNAKMHLMEAIMDLKIGNTKGAMTEMNLTAQSIKMHEQEIKSMMLEVKSMMGQMKGNTKSS
jgi:cob(I)alamin adenosyltransferase